MHRRVANEAEQHPIEHELAHRIEQDGDHRDGFGVGVLCGATRDRDVGNEIASARLEIVARESFEGDVGHDWVGEEEHPQRRRRNAVEDLHQGGTRETSRLTACREQDARRADARGAPDDDNGCDGPEDEPCEVCANGGARMSGRQTVEAAAVGACGFKSATAASGRCLGHCVGLCVTWIQLPTTVTTGSAEARERDPINSERDGELEGKE